MATSSPTVLAVAVPVPLHRPFDFLAPETDKKLVPGVRVRVPFGQRELIGLVVSTKRSSEVPSSKLRTAIEVLDDEPLFAPALWKTLLWLSRYYLAPIGEVVHAAIPAPLRQGQGVSPPSQKMWSVSDLGREVELDDLMRAPLQMALMQRFTQNNRLSASDFKSEGSGWRPAMQALVKKGLVIEADATPVLDKNDASPTLVELNPAQAKAAIALEKRVAQGEFSCNLLDGVTGSGKTEVYFAAIRQVLAKQQQVLLLVPEIGLTPQLLQRIEQNFGCGVVAIHSGLSEGARHQAWWHARQGDAGIIVGTRSAIFTTTAALGLIIVDEEHDASLKQQDGVRYHARDVAVFRAREENIPIILGSATPSLETVYNATSNRYQRLELPDRAMDSLLPNIQLIDLQRSPSADGLTPAMIEAIKHTLSQNKQVILFLNRRGYAPVLYCKQCSQTCQCPRCDSNLTLHRASNRMRCHHCGYETRVITRCAKCNGTEFAEVGEGTQRVEEALKSLLPDAAIVRIDRDSTRTKGALADKLEQVKQQQADIIVGTQLLAKGHDFSNVALVGVLGADQGLYSTDFRSREALFQQLLQVAGRAGRRQHQGTVLIQTAFPNEQFFQYLRQHDYQGFCKSLMQEREAAGFPPFSYIALIRAESTHQSKALRLLRQLKKALPVSEQASVMDAIPAPMERRAGRYRSQLLLRAAERAPLHQLLHQALTQLSDGDLAQQAKSVRWSIDVDPADLF